MHFGLIREITARTDRLIAGLDIGTTKVCAMVAEVRSVTKSRETGLHLSAVRTGRSRPPLLSGMADTGINIIGAGSAVSKGIRKGEVSSIEGIVESIRRAVREAETMAGVDIKSVHMGISGKHIACLSSQGVIALKDREIGQRDIDNVIEAAKAVAIPFDREVLHVIPVGYAVNGQNGIIDPRGMGGVRLETDVQIITGASTSIRNLVRSCDKAGLDVMSIVFQPLAAAHSVLTEDDKHLGVAVIDVGGGTTDIGLFQDGNLFHSSVLAIGGNNFTNDLAIGLRISTADAEVIKKTHGCALMSLVKEDEYLDLGHADDRAVKKIPRRYIVEILQPRAEELFYLIKQEIVDRGLYGSLNSGIVLTGGAALMEGMDVMAENILELPVRMGRPSGVGGLAGELCGPAHATPVGLVQYGATESTGGEMPETERLLSGFSSRMRGWVGGIFNI
jgi:cell division protein FtsA